MIIPSAPSNIQSRYTLLSLDDLFDPPRPIPPPPSTPLTPVEMFESVWDKWSIKRLVWKIRGYNDPLYGQDDLEQEAFLRVWQNVELKDREIQSVEGYVFTTVERRLLEILRQIVKDRWNLRGPVYYDQMEDKFFGFSDWDEALDVGPVDWSALPSVESRVKLGEVVSAIERYALTSEMRRATFGDLLAVSGATGEASNETLALVCRDEATVGLQSRLRDARHVQETAGKVPGGHTQGTWHLRAERHTPEAVLGHADVRAAAVLEKR